MKNIIRKLNHFFISENADEITRNDQLWFFGPFILMSFIVLIVMISTLLTNY